MPTLDDAIQYVRMGNRERGRQILEEILETDENNEAVWLWLSAVVDSDEDREICLENVLALDPNNGIARRGLEAVQAGNFNSNQMLGELLEQEEAGAESTFTDDFATTDDGLDEELALPSTMAKTKSKSKAKSKRGGGLPINPRLLILAALVLFVVVALAAVAAYSMFSGGGDATIEPVDNPPVQTTDQPAQPEEVVPAATDTPAPTLAPTDTPTPTATRLQLPTAVPTPEPTPTATRVVSPTPVR
jgi:hypothetical protein